jgi:geranylgeranyl reductase family protein
MSNIRFDVIVVGGGPSGSAAARTLAAAGRRVCLIDKAIFPRDKLCGGLVTLRSKRVFEHVFDIEWDKNLFFSSSEVAFSLNGRHLAEVHDYSTLFFTMRVDFDHYLLRLAERSGVDVRLGESISRVDLREKTATLSSGEELSFNFLVGADGVNSQIAKQLFESSFDPNTIGFGLEVEVPRERLPDQSNHVEIDFGAAHWGYGWVFPKKSTFTIGVGGVHKLNPDLRESLDQYLRLKSLAAREFKVKGQYIPFGDYRKRPGRGAVLLCGDAAGTVDPITGEGIAYAIQGGAAAARAILHTPAERPEAALDLYLPAYQEIASSIRQANTWRRFIFPKAIQPLFAWAFADAGTLQEGYLDILAGERDYDDLYGLFALQMAKAAKKLTRSIGHRVSAMNLLR